MKMRFMLGSKDCRVLRYHLCDSPDDSVSSVIEGSSMRDDSGLPRIVQNICERSLDVFKEPMM